MRILIVDDVDLNRRLAGAILKRQGWEIAEACDGLVALDLLGREKFDVVLLDISMPRLSGDEVCRRIKADPALAGMPVIAYTAHAMEEEKAQILAGGFDGILIKPIGVEALNDALRAVMSGRSGQ
jgi:CheY-like chemotaxis protein